MLDPQDLLTIAREEAELGKAEGGVPIGAALFTTSGVLLGPGHNRRVQDDDPSTHAETAAFRNAGSRPHYRDTVMVTTLSPCWYEHLLRRPRLAGGERRRNHLARRPRVHRARRTHWRRSRATPEGSVIR
jgi:hypothetical protein